MKSDNRNKGEGSNLNRAAGAVILDHEKYRPQLADEALSPDKEREFIETVWAVLLQATLLGLKFEFDAQEFCGKLGEEDLPTTNQHPDRVESTGELFQSNFSAAAGLTVNAEAERSRT